MHSHSSLQSISPRGQALLSLDLDLPTIRRLRDTLRHLHISRLVTHDDIEFLDRIVSHHV